MTHIRPKKLIQHGHERVDNYFWLRDRDNPEVLTYLENENTHANKELAHTQDLQKTIFEEVTGRIKKDDSTVPYRIKDYEYYVRYEEEKEYGIHCRRGLTEGAEEEIMLDGNEEAGDSAFFRVRGLHVSFNQDILAYAKDTKGDRIFTIYFKDLNTGTVCDEEISSASGAMAWANDNKTLFYARQDPITLRPHQIYRHELGTDPADDVLVYEEKDDTFWLTVSRSKSRKYLLIYSRQTITSEYRLISADNPTEEPRVFQTRKRGHEYYIDHLHDAFFILTNRDATNFKLCKTPQDQWSPEHWQEMVAHRQDTYLENFELFDNYLVTEERREGLTHLHILPNDGSPPHYLDFGEPAYLAYLGTNPEADTDILRFGYTSLTTPSSVYVYHMETREKTLKKTQEVKGFQRENYKAERLYAPGHDGTKIPISLVYRKDALKPGDNPLLLYGYGAYGSSVDPTFSSSRLSLLDRGFVYAIAHVRGGHELGRTWYDTGRLLHKKNSFHDFISCAQYLKSENWGHPNKLYANGGSAGGLLMGAVMNMDNTLFHGVVAQVPFVDVVTTMLDADLPLTTGEYDEWGNPEDETYYRYILEYSPYDNIEAKPYPHLLVTTGINDTQVHYWEPAKWVAKLRALKTDQNKLLLKTDLEVGHGGASGRFKQYEDTAMIYAFLLDLAGPTGGVS